MNKICFYLLISAAACSVGYGQETEPEGRRPERRLVDLSADRHERVDSAGTAINKLIGNVRLRQDETRLRADRATQYPGRHEILFVGNVVVYERGDTLSAPRVLYNDTSKVGRAFGSVRLTDGDVVVTAPSAVYDTRKKRTDFEEGVTLVDSSSVLVSEIGTYWSETKQAAFSGSVRLRTEDASIRADSMHYDRENEISRAVGNVFVYTVDASTDSAAADASTDSAAGDASTDSAVDTLSISMVVADSAFNDRQSGTERLRGDVLLYQVRFDSSSVDTLLMRSDVLRILRSDTLDRMFSIGTVRIWNMQTAAVADSVMYESYLAEGVRHETVHLFESPVAWFESSQIYGDTLRIASTGGEPDSVQVIGHTFLAEEDTVLSRVHQVKGRGLIGRFLGNGRRKMIVGPNADALYFLKDEDAQNGAVRTSADRIVFEFVEEDLKHVRAEGGVQGTYFPEGHVPDADLEGFRWKGELRPEKQYLMSDRRLASYLDVSPFRDLPPAEPSGPIPAAGAPQDEAGGQGRRAATR